MSGPTPADPAITTYARTVDWSISETANPTSIKQSGGTADVTYTVTVTQTGYTDTDHQLAGDVTLSNSNGANLVAIDVTDAVDNGGACVVTNGTNVDVPASGSITLQYVCTWTASPTASSGTDVATATWDAATNNTPDGTAVVDTPFVFSSPTSVINSPATVSDKTAGTLGTQTTTSTYQVPDVVQVPTSGCATYTDTASITQTGQTASAAVVACGVAGASVSTPSTGAVDSTRLFGLFGLLLVVAGSLLGAVSLRRIG